MSRLRDGMRGDGSAIGGEYPAGAKVVEREKYSDTDSFVINDCDFPLEAVRTFSGHFRTRADRGGQAFYGLDNYRFRDVITIPRPASGSWSAPTACSSRPGRRSSRATSMIRTARRGPDVRDQDSAGDVVLRDRGVERSRSSSTAGRRSAGQRARRGAGCRVPRPASQLGRRLLRDRRRADRSQLTARSAAHGAGHPKSTRGAVWRARGFALSAAVPVVPRRASRAGQGRLGCRIGIEHEGDPEDAQTMVRRDYALARDQRLSAQPALHDQ